MKLYKIVSLIALSVLLLVIGCTDRGVNYDKNSYELKQGTSFIVGGSHAFTPQLEFQISNKFQQLPMNAYLPKAAFAIEDGGDYQPVPTLFLLPPQDGDDDFYFNHGLLKLADELISTGEIQPMNILCISNDKIFGGYFYAGSSPAAGSYDSLIGDELIRWAEEGGFFPTAIRTKAKRGIGGFGMGAYGAFRAAMLHPDKFSSVSGVSGPMDFDGADGASGFMTLFDDVLNEQGITGLNLPNTFSYHDTWHLSRLFISGGFAFSAQDTLFNYTDTIVQKFTGQVKEYYLLSSDTLDPISFPSSNAISFPGDAVPPNAFQNDVNFAYRFHLPFDNVGAPVTNVWNRWLDNNLPTLFAANPNVFDEVNIWIANSSESTFGNYNEQTDSWVSILKAADVPVSEFNLIGYDGHPANRDQYVYDYLREMLIFHSESFGN